LPTDSSTILTTNKKSSNGVSDLVKAGDAAMESLDVVKAFECYQSAISSLKNNSDDELADALAKLGECKVSMGDQEGARDDFERAIDLLPSGSPKRAGYYFYLGQLSLQEEALEAYLKGIAELESCILEAKNSEPMDCSSSSTANDEPERQVQGLREQLARAHCTTAELYLTDLCYADDAEQQCESHVESAMKATGDDAPIIDALQVMASLRLSQQKEGAGTYMLQVYAPMKKGCEALATIVGLNETDEEVAVELKNVDAASNLPSFEFRCQSAKLLLECAGEECVRAAIQVLGSLLAENDEVVEIWYLLACAFEASDGKELAVEYWQQALEMLQKVQEGLKQEDEDDDDVIQQLNECEDQIADIENKLKRVNEEITTPPMKES